MRLQRSLSTAQKRRISELQMNYSLCLDVHGLCHSVRLALVPLCRHHWHEDLGSHWRSDVVRRYSPFAASNWAQSFLSRTWICILDRWFALHTHTNPMIVEWSPSNEIEFYPISVRMIWIHELAGNEKGKMSKYHFRNQFRVHYYCLRFKLTVALIPGTENSWSAAFGVDEKNNFSSFNIRTNSICFSFSNS